MRNRLAKPLAVNLGTFLVLGCANQRTQAWEVGADTASTRPMQAGVDGGALSGDSGVASPSAAPEPGGGGLSAASAAPATDAGSLQPGDAGVSDAGTGSIPAAGSTSTPSVAPFDWQLPAGFPIPPVPADNPMTAAKVKLGRYLFYDRRLSRDGTQACASCHDPARAFTDGQVVSVGITGQTTPRNSMSLANVAYASTLTWANPLQISLERQALVPLFGDNPVELGNRSEAELLERLQPVALYQELFHEAFTSEAEPITLHNLVAALASFERTLISGASPLDRYLYAKDSGALSDAARRGYELFNSEKLECFHCHVGFNLTDHVTYQDKPFIDRPYHNTGLYNIDGRGAYPEPNTGVHSVTQQAADMGRFKAPTLRNIARTAPYMHDGSIPSLSAVLDHYAAGGRRIESGPYAGDGSKSPLRSNLMLGFTLSDQERADVLAFFESLTDEGFLSDPRFSDPWTPSP